MFSANLICQQPEPLTWRNKLHLHAEKAFGFWGLAGAAAYSGIFQEMNSPREWGRSPEGYGKRFGSTLAFAGVRNAIALGVDTTMGQDPRYYRSGTGGAWLRTRHVVRGTVLTHTDSGQETFAMWRFSSAYSAAFLSAEWRPDRLDTAVSGFKRGSTQIGFDLLANFGTEFWPDVHKRLFRPRGAVAKE